jgi:AraC-like DNA-binding protein
MPPQLAVQLVELLEEQGVSRAHLLAGTGIRPVQLEREDTFIPYRQMVKLVRRALALSNTPALGLLSGSQENVSSWGMLGYTIMSCSTYREAFYTGLKFYRAASGMLALSAHEEGDRLCLHMEAPEGLDDILPFSVEEMAGGVVAVLGDIIGPRFKALELQASYPDPGYARLYRKVLSCPTRFNQPHNALWITRPDDTPLPSANPVSARMCRRLVEELLDKHSPEDNLVREVRRLLMRTPGQIPDMETVAAELGISSRGLRRQLQALDTSFRSEVDDVRKQLALGYLRDSSMNLEQIASLLGYTEVTNFRRAFKGWTGKAPSEFRGGGRV